MDYGDIIGRYLRAGFIAIIVAVIAVLGLAVLGGLILAGVL
jgi:hypothetical protein